jgi:hypothetical protein
MAHTLQIVYGSTTIDISTGDYAVSYTPRDPGGGETVTENATVRVMASSLANMQSDIRSINTAFEAARRRRKTGIGDRVYIKFQESGDSDTYRSEVWARRPNELPGRVTILDPTMYERIFTAEVAMLRISWSRRGYWEDNSETELSISNGSGTGTGGQTVVNPQGSKVINAQITISYTAPDTIADSGSGLGGLAVGDVISVRGSTSNDGIYTVKTASAASITVNEPVVTEVAGDSTDIYDMNSYVHIDSAAILGALPAACRIVMTNNDAGADLQTVWIGNNYMSEPDDFAHILEAEDSDTGSNTANAAASSGQYRAYAGISTPEAKITGWTIPTETLVAADSAYFKVIARFFDGSNITDVKFRLRIYYASQILYDGPQIEFDDTYAGISRLWRELDTIQLPPYLLEGNTPADLTLELWGISTSGGAETVNLDCLMLLPVNVYRKLYSISGVAQNSVLVDDGVLGIYYQTVSSELVSDITVEGEPIMLWPGIDNRIYFIQHSETANTADIDRAMSVQVYYRPRRVTL